tara:strand:+ start:3148 stop:3960 length:813 start_codon:yes stop_codon:yes gene_type:complete
MAKKTPPGHEIPNPEALLKQQKEDGADFVSEGGIVEPVYPLADEQIESLERDPTGENKMTNGNDGFVGETPREIAPEDIGGKEDIPGLVRDGSEIQQNPEEFVDGADNILDRPVQYRAIVVEDGEQAREEIVAALEEDKRVSNVYEITRTQDLNDFPFTGTDYLFLDWDLRGSKTGEDDLYTSGNGPQSGKEVLELVDRRIGQGQDIGAIIVLSSFGDIVADNIRSYGLRNLERVYIKTKPTSVSELGDMALESLDEMITENYAEDTTQV